MREIDDSKGDYNRPRRPSTDTLSYLRSLPLDEDSSEREVSAYVEYCKNKVKQQQDEEKKDDIDETTEEVDYPQSLSASISAIDEVRNELASLAGDEYGSQSLETLCRIAMPYSSLAARKLLCGISGYMMHLSTHRYGSHVLQTILQMSVHGNSNSTEISSILEIKDDDNDEDDIPSIKELILAIVDELLPFAPQLSIHICGSHVLRTLICILGGLELEMPVQFGGIGGSSTMVGGGIRRGKEKSKKKKKKKKKIIPENNDGGSSGKQYCDAISFKHVPHNTRLDTKDDSVKETLYSLTIAILNLDNEEMKKEITSINIKPPGALQQFACNPSAGPLLIVLLRVLTHSSSSIENDAATKIDQNDQKQIEKKLFDIRLGINTIEPRFQIGSFVEKLVYRILCWDCNVDNKSQKYVGDVIFGLSGEAHGSHLLECILRLAHDQLFHDILETGGFIQNKYLMEYVKHDVSNFVIQTLLCSIRTNDQAEQLINCLCCQIDDGYLLDKKNRRRGVLWRTVELSTKFKIGQKKLLESILKGFKIVLLPENEPNIESELTNTKLQINNNVTMTDCISDLISFSFPDKEGGKIGLDSSGVRTVYNLLRFSPKLCGGTLESICNYDSTKLEHLANDGLASRCIIDGILEGPIKQKPFADAIKQLNEKLCGRWVALSVERVGHHTVKKMFRVLQSMEDKASLSAELAQGINKLSGNSMGRSVILECAVKDFMEGEDVWKDAVAKIDETHNLFNDIFGESEELEKQKKKKRKVDKDHCDLADNKKVKQEN